MTASASRLKLAFYGDDFTGSTDALEVPSASTLRELGPFDAIGVAGASRSMSPAEMDAQLPAVLSALAALPVPLDCSPAITCATLSAGAELSTR